MDDRFSVIELFALLPVLICEFSMFPEVLLISREERLLALVLFLPSDDATFLVSMWKILIPFLSPTYSFPFLPMDKATGRYKPADLVSSK